MSVHRFEAAQLVPIARDKAWSFFSDPRNLARITPPDMGFRIVGSVPPHIDAGLIVRYRVRPIARVSVTWVTEITHVRAGEYFVDEQRVGPYRLWHHQHHLVPMAGGTLVRDVVHYALPFGWLGDVVNRLVVARRVRGIFAYRRAVLERAFGMPNAGPPPSVAPRAAEAVPAKP